jgi:hypothetical protein
MLATKNAIVTATNIRSSMEHHSGFTFVGILQHPDFQTTDGLLKTAAKPPKDLLRFWFDLRVEA